MLAPSVLCNIGVHLRVVHGDVCVPQQKSAILARARVDCEHIGVVDGPHDMGASFQGMRTTSQKLREHC